MQDTHEAAGTTLSAVSDDRTTGLDQWMGDQLAPTAPASRRRPVTRLALLTAAAVIAGVLLRTGTRSELWLDEVLSLNIARLPLDEIGAALRQDGAPPVYYVVLHGWTRAFGDSSQAVRSLSAVFSLATLPLAWVAGRRLGDRETAWTAVLLLATSPFAIRYATEARMYALVQLLALAGFLLLRRALERPIPARLAPLGLVAGLLPLTHYWTMFLLAATAAALVVLRRGDRFRHSAGPCLAALAAGALLFAPWVPSFLFQLRHTGNPWDPPAELGSGLLVAFLHFGGSMDVFRVPLGVILAGGALLAGTAHLWRARAAALISGGARPWAAGAAEVAVAFGGLVLGLVTSGAIGAAFSSRYASPMFPLLVLAAAVGLRRVTPTGARHAVVAVAVAAGLVGGLQNAVHSRTQAGEVARSIAAGAEPGDVVAYCPDQLGPAVDHLLPDWLHQLTYPYGGSPERVNWVDYAERNRQADPAVFARFVDASAGPRHTVWLVWREGYRTLGGGCERTATALRLLRPGGTTVVTPGTGGFEHHYVTRLPGS